MINTFFLKSTIGAILLHSHMIEWLWVVDIMLGICVVVYQRCGFYSSCG